jgi:hypothetical protein
MTGRGVRSVVSRLDVAANAGQKAPSDVRRVARDEGFAPVDLAPFSRQSRAHRAASIGRAAAQSVLAVPGLRRSGVLLAQHPLGRINDLLVARLARTTPSVLLVHDLESLRRVDYARRENQVLQSYDVIVVHTPAMADYVAGAAPRARTVVLGCFDYLVDPPPALAPATRRPEAVYVIGSLGPDKAAYLYGVGALALPVRAYGRGCVVERLPASVSWVGVLDMSQPQLPARDGFGLVWDGDSPDRLTGVMGEYLRYNSPHKFSMYLALGLPVLVGEGSALAGLVEREGIGLVARSVADAVEQAAACPPETWARLVSAVERVRQGVVTGDRTRAALRSALAALPGG